MAPRGFFCARFPRLGPPGRDGSHGETTSSRARGPRREACGAR